MTQEELDALMNGDVDLDLESKAQTKQEEPQAKEDANDLMLEDIKISDYKPNPSVVWPPPPPNQEHKVVHQLDDVTKDSELKATEMMDKLESINNFFADSENWMKEIDKALEKNIDVFSKLSQKFSNVESFNEALDLNNKAKKNLKDIINNLQSGQDEVMMAMDAMQYQDIHRQKIERVINVMRALSRYMSSLFEGRIDDKKRVSSAVHIEGDSTSDIVSNDDIEALIASLGQK
ncbi:chemotaxis protein [Campylobacter sp. VicNov18]|uniref:chemotaxis protein n=1 Tax=Campylobacter bilis TaxID=2691918 RepID=UPI00130E4D49|nr:chemotaxis protein [Campylobacter bilis]MPV63481.1 chemotaxis protein [Campylobacter hepaticus]MBM0636980.1 chemotaxis protein [Campylobacter bilis]MCC8277692.1 chemotaxis protein [Campylobacter bilis]MCC8299301.1 chemotaxis protein [Campylobacter bilis]MCC8300601.1 chemotaxis protein [Campylobacter bilis]